MDIDLDASRRLTARIAAAERRGDTARAERLRALRRTVDTRFDPEQALAGTVRYLAAARNGSAATTWPSSRTTWGSGT